MKRLLLIALVFMILIFVSCSSDYRHERYVIKDVSKPDDIVLYASDTTILPTNVSIHIIGTMNGECTFKIDNGQYYHTINFKDTIDYMYKNDWYEPQINVKYFPSPNITGDSIVIRYKIL